MTEPAHAAAQPAAARTLALAWRNRRMLAYLQRIARAAEQRGLRVMALKGAALQLLLYDQPDQRAMSDLDLLIHPDEIDAFFALLRELDAQPSQQLVRDDFFPRYYYEAEFTAGSCFPVVMDIHVRPFRTLRYKQFTPDDALWARAKRVPWGETSILVPGTEDMLLHLAVHWAIHGCKGARWRLDIERWLRRHHADLDWNYLLSAARQWRLLLPLRTALAQVEAEAGPLLPAAVRQELNSARPNWRDRLALWHAPRDDEHPVGHALVNMLTTPGARFVLGYAAAVWLPGREHMRQWYPHEHPLWLPAAHLARFAQPVTRHLQWAWRKLGRTRIEKDDAGQWQVRANRDLPPGTLIGRCTRRSPRHGARATTLPAGELVGKWRYLQVGARPNARLVDGRLIALRHLRPDDVVRLAPPEVVAPPPAAGFAPEAVEPNAAAAAFTGHSPLTQKQAA